MTIERMEWSEAVRLKKTRYYNGNPCKHGHIAQRATVSVSDANQTLIT